jgi:hypothetical protein
VAEHQIDLQLPPEEALSALRRTAEDWGAQFEPEGTGGQLHLPVLAGMRRGLVSGPVEIQPAGGGSRLVFRPESSVYYLQTAAVAILLVAIAGAGLVLVWPFFPGLIAVAPFGAILALGGWFLVVSRLRTSGPDDFLAAVEAQGEAPEGAGG